MKTTNYDLKWGAVMLCVLLMQVMLAVAFFTLHLHRVRSLPQADYSACAQYRTYIGLSQCMTLKVREFLMHPQWRAAQFACYMLLTIMGGIFCARYTGGQRQLAVPLIAVITALLAAVLFKPGGVISLAGMLGIPLGGAIFQVFNKRRDLATNSV
jgi:hypothetical protein